MNVLPLLLVTMLVGCDSATKRLDHGRALVEERKYDEAVKVYESIRADYPDTPEAGQVEAAIDDARVAVADHLFGDGKYFEAGTAYRACRARMEADRPVLDPKNVAAYPDAFTAWESRISDARDRSVTKADLDVAMDFVTATTAISGADEVAKNNGFTTAVSAWNRAAAPPFKEAVGTFVCEHRQEYNAFTYCKGLADLKVEGLTLMNASSVIDKVSVADEPCRKAAMLRDICGPGVAAEIEPALAAVTSAKSALTALRPEMMAEINREWRTPRASLMSLAAACEKTKREIVGLMKENSGASLEFVQNYWGSIGSGSVAPTTSQEGLRNLSMRMRQSWCEFSDYPG